MVSITNLLGKAISAWQAFMSSSAGIHFLLALSVFMLLTGPIPIAIAIHLRRQGFRFASRLYVALGSISLLTGMGQLLVRLGSPTLRNVADLMGIANVIPVIAILRGTPRAYQELTAFAEAKR